MSLRPGESITPLLSADQIAARIGELADQIRRDCTGGEVLLVGILKGSYLFHADLARAVGEIARVDFMQASSYHDGKSSTGVVQIRKDLDTNIEGRDVVLVEDIVDTGLTLEHLKRLLTVRQPASLRVCSLLSKPDARIHENLIDYLGFSIPNEFVVGYGLDYGERFRTLPYIGILNDPAS